MKTLYMNRFLQPRGLEPYMTTREAAEALQVSTRLVRARCQRWRERVFTEIERTQGEIALMDLEPRPDELECNWAAEWIGEKPKGLRYFVRAACLERLTVNRVAADGRPLGPGRQARSRSHVA